jgi:hypothetical protein
VLEDLGGEHPVPALPSCGLCDALVLVLLESLQNLDTALCKNRGVAFHAWLYNLLGGAAEKLVSPPRFGNTARKMPGECGNHGLQALQQGGGLKATLCCQPRHLGGGSRTDDHCAQRPLKPRW